MNELIVAGVTRPFGLRSESPFYLACECGRLCGDFLPGIRREQTRELHFGYPVASESS